jgi:hypothetical protein
MKPRDPPPRPALHPKDALSIKVSHAAAVNEMMFKQNQDLVDRMRQMGKNSTNMLVRVQMMGDTNPVFANSRKEDLPLSLTTNSFGQSKYPETIALPHQQREDLVKGGSGENVYLVSRGVVPSVIPAKYDSAKGRYMAKRATTHCDTYPDHPLEHTKLVQATNAGQAMAKEWASAASRKKELEMELDSLDSQIANDSDHVHQSATRHGLFGRSTTEGVFNQNDNDRNNQSNGNLLGLTANGPTTMKQSFIEHSKPKRMTYKNQKVFGGMQYSLLVPDTDIDEDPNSTIDSPKIKKTMDIGKYKNVRIPHDPNILTKKRGSEVVGSAFNWYGARDKSIAGDEFSWPSDKLIHYNHDKEVIEEIQKYGKYDITKTRYGDLAKELDYGKSVYVKSLKEIKRHNAKKVG